jgi:predicted nucleic acid-binding protein
MAVLLDTNVLVRLANVADPKYPIADKAVFELHRRGETLHITPQNLIEFRNVATRPKAANGLELPIPDAEAKAAEFEALFPLLPETKDIFPAWKALVASAGVIGKQVHDARLAAVCQVHGVNQLLTFNTAHFALLATFAPGIIAVDPASV